MRKGVLLGLIGAFTIASAAYGAVTVTNKYVVHARLTPVKSGTKANPVPIAGHFDYEVSTSPSGYRPNIVKTLAVRIQGASENTNLFPACGSSRLTDPSEGPSTCPAKSKVATGYFIAEVTKQGDQSPPFILTCRVELTIYNGGNHTLTYWVYKGASPSPTGQPECPLPSNEAIVAAETTTPKGLVTTVTFPPDVLHPTVAGVTYDAAVIKAVANFSTVTKQIKKGPKGHKKTVTIGLFDSIACPANHKRQVADTFTQENGGSRTTTRLVACK